MFRIFRNIRIGSVESVAEASLINPSEWDTLNEEVNNESSLEIVLNFESIDEAHPVISEHQLLTVDNCSSMTNVLEKLPNLIRGFFFRFLTAICMKFIVNDESTDLSEVQFHNFVHHLKGFSRSFLVAFESSVDGSCSIYWKLKDNLEIFSLKISSNSAKVGDFVKDFLVSSLRNNRNGLHPSIEIPTHRIYYTVLLDMLSDFRPYNLLFIAAKSGKAAIVKFMLQHFDVNHSVNEQTAVDLAYRAKSFDTVLVLLEGNSRYPVNFRIASLQDTEELLELKKFILKSKKIHEAIDAGNEEEILMAIDKSPGLRHFYDLLNRSVLTFAIQKHSLSIYKLLVTKNISLGPHEILDDILNTISSSQRHELSEFIMENRQNLADSHILTLLANSNVGFDDTKRQTRTSHVLKAFQKLNEIPAIEILLKLTAATRDFQIVFDFNRDEVQFLDPSAEPYTNGLFYLNGRIYVAAMHLLDEKRAHEVYGVIAHEICHFVMFKVFENHAKPFRRGDEESLRNFRQILEQAKLLKQSEQIIGWVFDCYEGNQQIAELIVRIPHILGHYHDNPSKTTEILTTFAALNDFYNDFCLPEIQRRLPQIEEENEEKNRQKYSQLKIPTWWKRLQLLVIALFCICLFLLYVQSHEVQHPLCLRDTHCASDRVCINNLCHDLCLNNPCLKNERCMMDNHEHFCNCVDGYERFAGSEICKKAFYCPNGTIIEYTRMCDSMIDCKDGSDELDCVIYQTVIVMTIIGIVTTVVVFIVLICLVLRTLIRMMRRR